MSKLNLFSVSMRLLLISTSISWLLLTSAELSSCMRKIALSISSLCCGLLMAAMPAGTNDRALTNALDIFARMQAPAFVSLFDAMNKACQSRSQHSLVSYSLVPPPSGPTGWRTTVVRQ